MNLITRCQYRTALALLVAVPMAVALASAANQGTIRVPGHRFYSVREFLGLSEPEQRLYASGLVDGMLLARFLKYTPSASDEKPVQCLKGVSDEQVATILKKHFAENPEHWNLGANAEGLNALLDLCPEFKPDGATGLVSAP